MRIISGKLKGRKIHSPKDKCVRPTSDRVRGSIFDILFNRMLEDNFHGKRVLDVFAGTWAMGLEALSRGVSSTCFVEKSKGVLDAIEQNAKILGVTEQCTFIKGDLTKTEWLSLLKVRRYEIAFLDPPYNTKLIEPTLRLLSEYSLLARGAIVIVELEASTFFNLPLGYQLITERKYGSTAVNFLTWDII